MHPFVALLLLALVCSVGPYVLGTALAVALAIGFFVGAIEYVTAAMAGFTPGGPITHLRITPPPESEDGPDPAYRSYYAGPVLLDYQKVLAKTFEQVWAKIVAGKPDQPQSLVNKVWHWKKTTITPGLLAAPTAVAVTIGLTAGALAALGFVTVSSLVFFVLLLALVLGALITAGGSRLIELGLLFLRGITIECGGCHEKATRPIYRCSQCDAAHRRLVPGMAGVLRRTCRCHTKLPTLLALGKTKLRAQCPKCKNQLPIKGLSAPTVHIPVIAGPRAGKSVYMFSAISRLMLAGDGFEFADERAKDDFERNIRLGVHEDPKRAVKTVITRPRAYNVFVGEEGSRARRLLYLYDPAGESVESVEHLADAQFLSFTKGIVFIVDPFSLRQVRSGTDRAVLGRVGASNTAPKEVLERFVEALSEKRISRRANRITVPLALVLTKTDGLLDPSGANHPYAELPDLSRESRDVAVRAWLMAMGQNDLLSSVDNHFSSVSYFAVSYQDAVEVSARDAVINDDPSAPVQWLLNRKGRS